MTLADLTRERLCVAALRGRDYTGVLLELSLAFADAGIVADSLSLFNAALNGRFLSESDVLGTVAYPIVRFTALESTVLAVGRTRVPICWRHGFPAVRLIFLVATPTLHSRRVSRLTAAILELARNEEAVAALHAVEGRIALLEALRGTELPGGEPPRRVWFSAYPDAMAPASKGRARYP